MGKAYNEQEAYNRDVGFDLKMEYDASNNTLYVGRAYPGAATSAAKWQIYKMEYDANNNMTSLRWAKKSDKPVASDEFDKVWDDRTSYTYTDV